MHVNVYMCISRSVLAHGAMRSHFVAVGAAQTPNKTADKNVCSINKNFAEIYVHLPYASYSWTTVYAVYCDEMKLDLYICLSSFVSICIPK